MARLYEISVRINQKYFISCTIAFIITVFLFSNIKKIILLDRKKRIIGGNVFKVPCEQKSRMKTSFSYLRPPQRMRPFLAHPTLNPKSCRF